MFPLCAFLNIIRYEKRFSLFLLINLTYCRSKTSQTFIKIYIKPFIGQTYNISISLQIASFKKLQRARDNRSLNTTHS